MIDLLEVPLTQLPDLTNKYPWLVGDEKQDLANIFTTVASPVIERSRFWMPWPPKAIHESWPGLVNQVAHNVETSKKNGHPKTFERCLSDLAQRPGGAVGIPPAMITAILDAFRAAELGRGGGGGGSPAKVL